MPFSYRKSVKVGPLRVNFSKSGVGLSAGVKGFRVSTNSRGTYINAGRGGFSYRQKIGGPWGSSQNGPMARSTPTPSLPSAGLFHSEAHLLGN